jgi:transposase InsO family protein
MPPDSNTAESSVLLAIDHFSKFAWAEALFDKNSFRVRNFLLKLFRQEGCWDTVGSDNGSSFVAEDVQFVYRELNIKLVNGRPYHPQEQGAVERLVRTLKKDVPTPAIL